LASIAFIAGIVAVSVGIYIYRDQIRALGAYGYIGVFLLCFICNATVLVPAPSLIVIISSALVLNPYFVALVGSCSTTLGELVGYISGYIGKNIVAVKDHRIFSWVKKYGCPIIFIFALLPMPLFDIVGLASGYLKIRW
jgi:membrane protein YqaA with SNARE-associated domain